MSSYNKDLAKVVGKEMFDISGYFTTDGAGAVSVQTPLVASGAPFTASKPAGTGIYRITLTQTVFDVQFPQAVVLKAAGTLNAKVDPVTVHQNSQGFVDYVEFQVRQSSDGTALDFLSGTVYFRLHCKDVSVRP